MKKICTLLMVCASVISLYAQRTTVPAQELRLRHHETEDDPYLPNAWNNRRVKPAYRYQSPALPQVQASSVFTTQVNVDASGLNILDDAANEPSIAINPLNPDEMVIGWRQFDNVLSNFRQAGWAYSANGGTTWIFPGLIEPGIFRSDPVLDFDANGQFFYNSLTNSPTFMCKIFRSTDGGMTWDFGVDAFGGDKQWMAIDRTSSSPVFNVYSDWTQDYSSCQPGHFTRSTDGGDSYSPCDSIPASPFFGMLVVDENGILYTGGASSITDSMVVVKSLNAQNPAVGVVWEPYVGVDLGGTINGWGTVNPEGLFGMVNLDVDRSTGAGAGNVYMLASVYDFLSGDPADVKFARSSDGGTTWSPPVRVNDDISVSNTQWFGTMSVAPTGRIDVVWLNTREDFAGLDSSALYYSYSYDQGVTWSVNEKVSALFDPHVGYPAQLKMGDYFDMISDSLGAHLAWANTFNGEEDVYYSYIQPPVTTGMAHVPGHAVRDVYPNPASGVINFSGPAVHTDLEIRTLQGELVYSAPTELPITRIDLSALPKGLYFLKAVSKDGDTFVRKIILQ